MLDVFLVSILFLFLFQGKVKTSGTCTDVPMQWHKPKTGAGRQLKAISVDELMKVPKVNLVCSSKVTNEYFQRCIHGKLSVNVCSTFYVLLRN